MATTPEQNENQRGSGVTAESVGAKEPTNRVLDAPAWPFIVRHSTEPQKIHNGPGLHQEGETPARLTI
ncbi:MAG: hypothetical protein AABP62_24035 [Planctomycetota bacterium]